MPRFVDLDRRFVDLTDVELEDTERLVYLSAYEYGPSVGWRDLLEHPRVILLADAGAGKTREMQEQVRRLVGQNYFAFFLPLEMLDTTPLREVLSGNEEERLEQWITDGQAPAWFFLDAVDELKVTKRKLARSLQFFSKTLERHLARARVVLSCRPNDWLPNLDLATVKEKLPVPLPVPVSRSSVDLFVAPLMRDGRESHATAPTARDGAPRTVARTVAMLPMNDGQISHFVEKSGITDKAAAFLTAVSDQNAWKFCRRPFDLIELVTIWAAFGHLGTLAEQHEANVTAKLRDAPGRFDYDILPDAKARSGAGRLALALTLTHSRSIRSPERPLEVDEAQTVLDAADILRDWTEAERQVLLRRALFDPATYGRVRFHHRSVQEYLAAQQLLALRQANMSTKALFRLLFAELYGVKVVRPSMRPVAAWLALWDDAVRTELLRRDPVALLSLGDPQTLDVPTRCAILRAFAAAYGQGRWRGLELPQAELRRLADPALASTIRECWGTGPTNDDLRELLVTLIWLGPIPECADLALAASRNDNWRPYDRIVAVRALNACGDTVHLRELGSDMLHNSTNWPSRVVHGVAEVLFPGAISVNELLALIRQTQEPRQSAGGFGQATCRIAGELDPWSDAAVALRVALATLIEEHAQHDYERGEITSDYDYLANALATLCSRQLAADCGRCDSDFIIACVVAFRCGEYDLGRQHARGQLRDHFSPGAGLRGPIFWAELEFLDKVVPTDGHWDRFYNTTQRTLLGHFAETDRPWLQAALGDRTRQDRRFVALYVLLSLWSQRGGLASEVEVLRDHLQGDEELNALLTQQSALEARNLACRQEERQERRRARQEQRDRNGIANWLSWRESVVNDPVDAFSEERRGDTLYNVRKWLDAYAHGTARFDTWDKGALTEAFGVEVADRAENEFRRTWRRVHPLLWSARREEEKDTTLTTWVEGLVGVSAEASNPGWAARLSEDDARVATAYAAIELNGFAAFVFDLVGAYPGAVEDVLGSEVSAQLRSVGSRDYLPIVQALAHAESSLKVLLARRLAAELQSWPSNWEPDTQPHFVRHLEEVLEILQTAGNEVDRVAVTDECARRYEVHKDDLVGLTWLKGWFLFDGIRAAEVLMDGLKDDNDPNIGARARRTLATVFGSGGVALGITDPAHRANVLGQLTLYAHRFVRPVEDVVHEGTFTPGIRDEAEDARRTLLNGLLGTPGPTARNVILDLADQDEFAEMSDRLRRLAEERVADDAEFECAFSPGDVNALFNRHEGPPQGRDDLFAIMNDRLEDLGYDLAHHDFTDRVTVCRITRESEIQRVLALRLHERRNNLYVVTREEEVADQKQPDIRLSVVDAKHRAAIEVKIADNWTLRELERALDEQLVGQYLRHENCSVGCLLLTYHGRKGHWVDSDRGLRMEFAGVVRLLKEQADQRERDSMYSIRVSVFGLDLTAQGG